MASTAINGTLLLVYMDGVKIAAQKNVTMTLDVATYPASTKDSARWACHGKGERSFEVALDGLLSTTGKTAKALYDYMINGTALLLVIEGTTNTYFATADMTNVALTGPQDEASTLSGTIKATGLLYTMLTNLLTELDGTGSDGWDTIVSVGLTITDAQNDAGAATIDSNAFTATDTKIYKLVTFLTLVGTGVELPTVGIYDPGVGFISNEVALTEGINFVTLTATDTQADAHLRIAVTGATEADFTLTTTYLWLTN